MVRPPSSSGDEEETQGVVDDQDDKAEKLAELTLGLVRIVCLLTTVPSTELNATQPYVNSVYPVGGRTATTQYTAGSVARL